MELRQLIIFYTRFRSFLLALIILGCVLGYLAYQVIPESYSAHLTVFVSRPAEFEAENFSYDGYYAQLAGRGMADNVSSLITSVSLLASLYPELSVKELESLKKDLTAKVVATNVVEVSLTRRDNVSATSQLNEIVAEVGQVVMSQDYGESSYRYLIVGAPVVFMGKMPLWIYLSLGSAWSFLVGLLFLSGRAYFKGNCT